MQMNLVSAEYNRATGIGNKLFPWARAKILSHELGIPMLKHVWVSPRAGAITRGGINYWNALGKIWLVNNFRSDPTELSWPIGLFRDRELERCNVDNLTHARASLKEGRHYVFRWNTCHSFEDLRENRGFLRKLLYSLAEPRQAVLGEQVGAKEFVALNVRTGRDFVSKASGRNGYYLTEVEWFAEALKETRARYGTLPAIVVSDGGARELSPLLKMPMVELLHGRTAIADLLVLSKAKVLLGSGNSSFSAWASFLGGMDTFSSAETPFDRFLISDGRQVVGTL